MTSVFNFLFLLLCVASLARLTAAEFRRDRTDCGSGVYDEESSVDSEYNNVNRLEYSTASLVADKVKCKNLRNRPVTQDLLISLSAMGNLTFNNSCVPPKLLSLELQATGGSIFIPNDVRLHPLTTLSLTADHNLFGFRPLNQTPSLTKLGLYVRDLASLPVGLESLPSLASLDIKYYPVSRQDWARMPLTLRVLDLMEMPIVEVPCMGVKRLRNLVELQVFSCPKLTSIDLSCLPPMLNDLSLRNNSIPRINLEPLLGSAALLAVSVDGNPLVCDCGFFVQILQLLERGIDFASDKCDVENAITCQSGIARQYPWRSSNSEKLRAYDADHSDCTGRAWPTTTSPPSSSALPFAPSSLTFFTSILILFLAESAKQ